MTTAWSWLDDPDARALITCGATCLFGLCLGAWWAERVQRRAAGNRARAKADVLAAINAALDAEFAAILDVVTAARTDIDQFDDIDLKADDLCEWLELRHDWMGSDQ